ncbi:potassium channel family protein [Christiangramia echinicola]|uniref:potassium channel family protein n=1 Tax=Christiangramia echinicola TaxID=279359 RepID=UPI00040B10B2|nr:potassium channel family protein [Christiangramia echinicola]
MEIFLIIGIFLYISIAIDILQTTLSMQGGGWLTSRISHLFWKFFLLISGRNGKSKILGHAGYILLTSIVFVWVFFLWASFTFILYAYPGAVEASSSKIPADFWQLVYYAGFSISTLGMGDYIPTSNFVKILTSFYSFTGLILLTMSVTYFIPVLSAVIEQRKLGVKLSALGNSPQEIVLNAWNGNNFERLTNKIDGISDSIVKYSQQHRAYPVIHYFHSIDPETTVILQLARLFEALHIIRYKVPEDTSPPLEDLRPLIIAFQNYFKVVSQVTHFSIKDANPKKANINRLYELKLIPEKSEILLPDHETKHRRLFSTLIYFDGWSWGEVDPKKS